MAALLASSLQVAPASLAQMQQQKMLIFSMPWIQVATSVSVSVSAVVWSQAVSAAAAAVLVVEKTAAAAAVVVAAVAAVAAAVGPHARTPSFYRSPEAKVDDVFVLRGGGKYTYMYDNDELLDDELLDDEFLDDELLNLVNSMTSYSNSNDSTHM